MGNQKIGALSPLDLLREAHESNEPAAFANWLSVIGYPVEWSYPSIRKMVIAGAKKAGVFRHVEEADKDLLHELAGFTLSIDPDALAEHNTRREIATRTLYRIQQLMMKEDATRRDRAVLHTLNAFMNLLCVNPAYWCDRAAIESIYLVLFEANREQSGRTMMMRHVPDFIDGAVEWMQDGFPKGAFPPRDCERNGSLAHSTRYAGGQVREAWVKVTKRIEGQNG